MTPSGEYSVRAPDPHNEVTKPVRVSHNDDPAANRQPRRLKKRKRDPRRGPKAPAPWPPGEDTPDNEGGDEHLVDTLA